MTTRAMTNLECVLRECDLGWVLDWFDSQEQALDGLRSTLEQAAVVYREQHHDDFVDEEELPAAYRRDSEKIRAFLQALVATRTPDMLVMVWRVLQGLDIHRVEMNYCSGEAFMLRIVLRSPADEEETYESNDVDDAALLRHFGITKMYGRPLLAGYYPLHLK